MTLFQCFVLDGLLTLRKVSEKTNEPIPRKLPEEHGGTEHNSYMLWHMKNSMCVIIADLAGSLLVFRHVILGVSKAL